MRELIIILCLTLSIVVLSPWLGYLIVAAMFGVLFYMCGRTAYESGKALYKFVSTN